MSTPSPEAAVAHPLAAKEAERRAARRRPLRTALRMQTSTGAVLEGRTLDISVGGLACASPVNPTVGERWFVRFQALDGTRLASFGLATVVASSVYSAQAGAFRVGLSFVSVPAEAAEVIKRLVDG